MADPPRQCMPFQVDYCRKLPYNFTSFPNAMSHADVHEAKHDIEMFKYGRGRSWIQRRNQSIILTLWGKMSFEFITLAKRAELIALAAICSGTDRLALGCGLIHGNTRASSLHLRPSVSSGSMPSRFHNSGAIARFMKPFEASYTCIGV